MANQKISYMVTALLVVLVLVDVVSATNPTSMVIDFDSTPTDLTLEPGESGVLNLVLENTGGQSAEDVKVKVYSTASLSLNKEFYLGTVVAGGTKAIPIVVRATSQANTGLAIIKVQITYDGYDSDGDSETNQYTNWEIPVIISQDSIFQVEPSESSYFVGAQGNLVLECMPLNSVRDLEATLSSECIMVMGSSKRYVGNIDADQKSEIIYSIKPLSSGACQTTLELEYKDEFGTETSEEIYIGLNVEDAGVNFKVVDIDYNRAGPGSIIGLTFQIKNEGQLDSDDTTLSLSLEDPFAPVGSVEKYVGTVAAGETVEVEFGVSVSWDAETDMYSVPLEIDYKIDGTSFSEEKDIGIDVTGEVIFEIINVESSSGTIQVEVANIGTRSADAVKATLVMGGQASTGSTRQPPSDLPEGFTPPTDRQPPSEMPEGTTQTRGGTTFVDYKSDIKAGKQATFTFDGASGTSGRLTLEYTGQNNERVEHTEQITLSQGGTGTTLTGMRGARGGGGNNTTNTIIWFVVICVALYLGYRIYKKRKRGPEKDEVKNWKNLYGLI